MFSAKGERLMKPVLPPPLKYWALTMFPMAGEILLALDG